MILKQNIHYTPLYLFLLCPQEGEETASQTSDELDLEVQEVMKTIKDGVLEDEEEEDDDHAEYYQAINQTVAKPQTEKKAD